MTLFLMLVVLKWNIYAVVLSKIIFSGAICVLNAKALRDRIGYVQEKKKTFVIPALASLIMGVIAVLVHLIFELFAGPYIATIIALLAAVVTYGVAIVVLGGITEEELLGIQVSYETSKKDCTVTRYMRCRKSSHDEYDTYLKYDGN